MHKLGALTQIVSGFPGVGKSYLYQHQEEFGIKVLDSDSSKFSWLKDNEGNNTKVRNPDFPNNYIEYIVEACKEGSTDVIMVSTHKIVLNALYDHHFSPIVMYPSIELKEEYIERYKARGNNEKFVKFISDNWDNFITSIDNDCRFNRYKLKAGQFMKDIDVTDWKEIYTHFAYQNDNRNINDTSKKVCAMCQREIGNYGNYITNNHRDICISCAYDVIKCLSPSDTKKIES